VLVIDHDRFAACLAGMMMFRCRGRLDRRRCNQGRAENCDKRLSHFDLRNAGRPFLRSLLPSFNIFKFLRGLLRPPLKAAPEVSAPVGEGISRHCSRPKPPLIHDAYLTRPATRHAVWELKTSTFVASLWAVREPVASEHQTASGPLRVKRRSNNPARHVRVSQKQTFIEPAGFSRVTRPASKNLTASVNGGAWCVRGCAPH
jgi:hypothetical protein